jgi:hypothetical protein
MDPLVFLGSHERSYVVLFVLAMKVFSCLMSRMVGENDFILHWLHEKEHLTRVLLMIFYRVELGTVFLIKHNLDQFWLLSGLSPNHVICSYVVFSLILYAAS